MQPESFTIQSTKPFANKPEFLNFTAQSPTRGQFDGIVWEQALHGYFHPGAQLTVQVGATKNDGACFVEYKGKTRLELSKGAQIAPGSTPAPQQAAPAPVYHQPAPAAPAPVYAAPAPTVVYQQPGQHTGEEIMERCAYLARIYSDALQRNGFDRATADNAAANVAPNTPPSWWFGDNKWC